MNPGEIGAPHRGEHLLEVKPKMARCLSNNFV